MEIEKGMKRVNKNNQFSVIFCFNKFIRKAEPKGINEALKNPQVELHPATTAAP